MLFTEQDRFRDVGLLILRIGIGISFMLHGFPKLMGGPEAWTRLGGAMRTIGIEFTPAFFGFMAAFAEFGGGVMLAAGLLTRPACALLAFTMLIAMMTHLSRGDGFNGYSHALEAMILFLSMILIGPGRISLDTMVASRLEARAGESGDE